MTEAPLLLTLRANFVRNAILGALVVIAFLLLWKLLGFTGVTAVIPLVGGWVQSAGLPPVIGQIAAVILIVLIAGILGWAVRTFISSERGRFPLIAQVLSTEEQLHAFLRDGKGAKQDRVVLVDWPNSEVRTLGIITGEIMDENTGREFVFVYMPNTPNPTGGTLKLVDREKTTVTNLSVGDVLALCFSRGAMVPRSVILRQRTLIDEGPE